MRLILLIMLLSLYLCSGASAAPPHDIELLINNLIADSGQNLIWPGYDPLSRPVLLHVKNHGSYLVNARKIPNGFKAVKGFLKPVCFGADTEGDSVASGFITHYPSQAGDVFFYNYRGLVMDSEITILHETFHVFQEASFSRTQQKNEPGAMQGQLGIWKAYKADIRVLADWVGSWRKNNTALSEQHEDANTLVDTYIENKLLAKALLERNNYKTWAAKYVRLRDYLDKELSPSQLTAKLEQEKIEGTAQYVGWCGVASNSLMFAENHHAGLLLSPELVETAIGRFYVPPAAMGFLLDRAGIAWEKRVQRGEDIYGIMRETFTSNRDSMQPKAIIRELCDDNLHDILAAQHNMKKIEEKRMLDMAKNYNGWKLVLHYPDDCDSTFLSVGEGVPLGMGRYYPKLKSYEVVCRNLQLRVAEAGVMFEGRDTTVLLGDKPWLRISADGHSVPSIANLNHFNSFTLKTEELTVSAALPGMLSVQGKNITLDFLNKGHK